MNEFVGHRDRRTRSRKQRKVDAVVQLLYQRQQDMKLWGELVAPAAEYVPSCSRKSQRKHPAW